MDEAETEEAVEAKAAATQSEEREEQQ
jgi:hypothetical protein